MTWLSDKVRRWLGTDMVFDSYSDIAGRLYSLHGEAQRTRSDIRALSLLMMKMFNEQKEAQMRNMEVYNAAIKDLADKVAALSTVEQSAVALIQGLREKINSLITDSDGIVPVEELQKLSSAIDVGTKTLADAVAAGTAPEPEAKPADPAQETNPAEEKPAEG